VVVEETERVIGERRITFLGRFAALVSASKSRVDVSVALAECLKTDSRDIPFSLTYLFDAEGKTAQRFCVSGFQGEHEAAPERISVELESSWPFAEVLAGGEPQVVELDSQKSWPRGPWK